MIKKGKRMKLLKPLLFATLLSTSWTTLAVGPIQVEQAIADTTNASTIDINFADVDTLTRLPGIGKTKAQAIVDYRKANGNFATTEDLKQVKGIGDKLYSKLKAQVSIH
jgi:competence protein ComEA